MLHEHLCTYIFAQICFHFSLEKYLEKELLHHGTEMCLIYEKLPNALSPCSDGWKFSCYTSPTFDVISFPNFNHSSECLVIFLMVLFFIFLMINDVENYFPVFTGHLAIFFGEAHLQEFCPFGDELLVRGEGCLCLYHKL